MLPVVFAHTEYTQGPKSDGYPATGQTTSRILSGKPDCVMWVLRLSCERQQERAAEPRDVFVGAARKCLVPERRLFVR